MGETGDMGEIWAIGVWWRWGEGETVDMGMWDMVENGIRCRWVKWGEGDMGRCRGWGYGVWRYVERV